MSQAKSTLPADLESGKRNVDDHRNLPQPPPSPNQNHPSSPGWPPSRELDSDAGAWPLFSMYCKIAEEEDNKLIKRYQKEANEILIFAGLFTATLASAVATSFQDLKPNPQDTSAFYLKMIYQLLAQTNPNALQPPIPPTLPTPPAFSPPRYAVWVNSLWFLSLASSLTSAVSAMLLQQWARRYVMVTQQPWLTPCQRARVRELLSDYTHGPYLFWGVTPMAFFIYLSIILYMAGGLVYLFNTNRVVFGSLGLWATMVAILSSLYTAASIFKPEMLFYAPISPLIMRICLGLWYTVLQASSCIPPLRRLFYNSRRCYLDLSVRYHQGLLKGKCMAVEEDASKRSSEIDPNVLAQTLNYVVEDANLEKFFGAVPGFLDSKPVNDLQGRLSDKFRTKFQRALHGFLDHTFSSSTFTGSARGDRLVTCLNAACVTLGPGMVLRILGNIFDGRWPAALQSIEVGHALKRWNDIQFSSHLRRIVARIVSRVLVRDRDDRWIALVQDEFGVPDHALRGHVGPGDGASIAILIHITRQFLRTDSPPWDLDILRGFSDFDIRNTIPAQQQDFCTTWNEVVREAQSRGPESIPVLILKEIHHLHAALHQDTTDAVPASYGYITSNDKILVEPIMCLSCYFAGHRQESTGDPRLDKGTIEDAPLPHSALHEVPDAMPLPFLTPTPSQPVPSEGRNAAAAEISLISRVVNAIPRPTFGDGPVQRNSESMPSLNSHVIHSVPPASVNAVMTRTDHVSPMLGIPSASPSLSDGACLSVPPHVSTILDQSTTIGVGGACMDSDSRDPNLPISLEVYSQPRRSAPLAANIATNTLRCDSEVQRETN